MQFNMHRILNIFTWIFLVFFIAPTVMIIISWNTLPGDALYGMKLTMERALAVLMSPSYTQRTSLEVGYTQKRFNEAQRLLSEKQSTKGLSYLSDQVKTTKQAIDSSKDAQDKAAISQAYIDALNDVYNQLESDKQQLTYTPSVPSGQTQESAPSAPFVGSRVLPPKTARQDAPTASSINTPTTATGGQQQPVVQNVYVTVQIIQTQQIIRQTITELNQNTQTPAPTPTPTPTTPPSAPAGPVPASASIPTPTNTPIPTPTPTSKPDFRAKGIAPGADDSSFGGLSAPSSANPTDTPVPTQPPVPTDTPVPTPVPT